MLTPEHAAARRCGIGGSDVAAIVGESRYRSAIDVWLDKRGESPAFDGNERTRWGEILEPVVAADYAERENVKLLAAAPKVWRHPARDWHVGSPDALCVPAGSLAGFDDEITQQSWRRAMTTGAADGWGLEIKTHGWRAGSQYRGGYGETITDDDDPIPPHVRIQCAWYQALIECDRWDLVALIDTADCRTYRIPRDPEIEAFLLEEAEAFWTRCVLGGDQPDPDGSPSFGRYLRKRFATHDAEIIEGDAELAEWMETYRNASDALTQAKRAREEAAQYLQNAIGVHLGVKTVAGLATWKEQQGRPSWQRVAEELSEQFCVAPRDLEALKDHSRSAPFRVLRVRKTTGGKK